jgi:hypothetical protein
MKITIKDKILNLEVDIDKYSNLKNGDYKLTHLYDENELKKDIKLSKIDQLVTWINQTFNYIDNIPLEDDIMLATYNLNNSNKADLIKLVNWLNKDNYD